MNKQITLSQFQEFLNNCQIPGMSPAQKRRFVTRGLVTFHRNYRAFPDVHEIAEWDDELNELVNDLWGSCGPDSVELRIDVTAIKDDNCVALENQLSSLRRRYDTFPHRSTGDIRYDGCLYLDEKTVTGRTILVVEITEIKTMNPREYAPKPQFLGGMNE